MRSKVQSPPASRSRRACCEASSDAACIRMPPIPALDQSVLRKKRWLGSIRASSRELRSDAFAS